MICLLDYLNMHFRVCSQTLSSRHTCFQETALKNRRVGLVRVVALNPTLQNFLLLLLLLLKREYNDLGYIGHHE